MRKITFTDEWQAQEYAKWAEGQGWDVIGVFPGKPMTIKTDGGKYKGYTRWYVAIKDIKGGRSKSTAGLPKNISEAIREQEHEAQYIPRTTRRMAKGAREIRGELLTAPDEIVQEAASGKAFRPAMEIARRRRSFDVVRGMKRSIPRAAPGARTVFGAGSEEPPAITQSGPARIASGGWGSEMPLIAGTGMGVPRDVAFQAGASKDMRFQIPRVGKLKAGHKALSEEGF